MRRALAFAILSVLALAAPAAAQEREAPRGITVLGEGAAFADNDIARFSFGVSVRRPTAARALRAASAVQRLVNGRLRAAGVARADLRTGVVTVRRGARVRGRRTFVATQSVTATVRRLARAGAIVDVAVRAGATSVSGPEFAVSDLQGAVGAALALAFADARAKAERLAAEAGVTLGPVVRIVERGAEAEDELDADAVSAPSAGRAAPPVSPGRTRVEAGVTVTFATG